MGEVDDDAVTDDDVADVTGDSAIEWSVDISEKVKVNPVSDCIEVSGVSDVDKISWYVDVDERSIDDFGGVDGNAVTTCVAKVSDHSVVDGWFGDNTEEVVSDAATSFIAEVSGETVVDVWSDEDSAADNISGNSDIDDQSIDDIRDIDGNVATASADELSSDWSVEDPVKLKDDEDVVMDMIINMIVLGTKEMIL